MAERASKSFYAVAKDAGVGDDLTGRIARVKGRGGAKISASTIKRWASEGLVKVTYRERTKKEHHRAQPIGEVKMTTKGCTLIKHSNVWRERTGNQ